MNAGLVYAAGAYAAWGLFPIYFRLVAAVPPLEIVLHRSVWSLAVMLVLLSVLRRWAWLPPLLRQPRQLGLFFASALLLSANWLTYVWAVNHGRVIEASLGYFINPLVSVLLGALVLRERLRPVQWAAVCIATAGVLWLAVLAGHPPWISLALALTFGFYGLMRKTALLGALEGLALETLLLSPIALLLLAVWTVRGDSALAHGDPAQIGWLVLSGPVTALPLLMFAAGARRLTLATLGLMQYIAPTLQFALGVWMFHEPFDSLRAVGFGLIWIALAVYTGEGWWRSRQRPAATLASSA